VWKRIVVRRVDYMIIRHLSHSLRGSCLSKILDFLVRVRDRCITNRMGFEEVTSHSLMVTMLYTYKMYRCAVIPWQITTFDPNLALPTASRKSTLDSQDIFERVMDPSPSSKAYERTSVLLLGWTADNDDTEAAGEVGFRRDSLQADLYRCTS
jgi:hypothetical protein